MNIAGELTRIARERPAATAIIECHRHRCSSITFAELDRRSDTWARALTMEGVKTGDAILVIHPMSIDLYTFLIAVLKAGVIAVFLDPTFGRNYIRKAFELCRPTASFLGAKARWLPLVVPELRSIKTHLVARRLNFLCRSLTGTSSDLPGNAPALITFTSGSTGQPKGIVRSHDFLKLQLDTLSACIGLNAGDIDMTTLPIFVLANIACGVTSVIPDLHHEEPEDCLRHIRQHHVRSLSAAPAFLQRLCTWAGRNNDTLPGLRRVTTGGGPVFPPLLRALQTMAPGSEIRMLYGSTECEPICITSLDKVGPEDMLLMGGGAGLLAGKPVDGIRVRLLQEKSGQRVWARNGQMGEVLVSGLHVVKGYLAGKGDQETKLVIDGQIWHRTGDAGYFDASGRLWLLGRWSAAIVDSRGTIFPFQVESAATQVPGVLRAACLQYDNRRVLLIEPSRDTAGRRIHKHWRLDTMTLKGKLGWAKIDEVHLVQEIPVDARHHSKVNYQAALQLLEQSWRLAS
jgi:olefin beta-lactone synthetase